MEYKVLLHPFTISQKEEKGDFPLRNYVVVTKLKELLNVESDRRCPEVAPSWKIR